MDKYSRYYGVIIFIALIVFSGVFSVKMITGAVTDMTNSNRDLETKQQTLQAKQNEKSALERKLKQLKNVSQNIQKKVYSPAESDLGNDTLFFTLYSDMIEMLHSNSIKIRSLEHTYNPKGDPFVDGGGSTYFVCNMKMELVSNYTNLGKLIQDIYQYPYYIKINSLKVEPYEKDKSILLSKLSVNLYARTSPEESGADMNE